MANSAAVSLLRTLDIRSLTAGEEGVIERRTEVLAGLAGFCPVSPLVSAAIVTRV